MNNVDATDRGDRAEDAEPPSLLTIILDTNPHAWALLEDSLPLSTAVANILIFINAHLAINHANRVAVVASHSDRAIWLYPTPDIPSSLSQTNGSTDPDVEMQDTPQTTKKPPDDANKYRPFAQLEHTLLLNLRSLLRTTFPKTLSPSTLLAGALTLSLSYISKQTLLLPTSQANKAFTTDPTALAGSNDLSTSTTTTPSNLGLTSRILLISVSGDLADQYIPLMNAIFACQRMSIPIDVLKLAGDDVFLQQASDTTGGIYISLSVSTLPGLLQTLMFAFLPDPTSREHLVPPNESSGVDFRAACFCHKRVVDVGYVCSICLSIFCEPFAEEDGGVGECLLCGSKLSLGEYGRRPVVVGRVRRKKKKGVGRGLDGGREETPGSGAGTPMMV